MQNAVAVFVRAAGVRASTGAASPAWEGNLVTGPGEGTLEDLTAILDLARKHEIRIMICLWSFDMLRISNGAAITRLRVSMFSA